jgi:hypothetical protein
MPALQRNESAGWKHCQKEETVQIAMNALNVGQSTAASCRIATTSYSYNAEICKWKNPIITADSSVWCHPSKTFIDVQQLAICLRKCSYRAAKDIEDRTLLVVEGVSSRSRIALRWGHDAIERSCPKSSSFKAYKTVPMKEIQIFGGMGFLRG